MSIENTEEITEEVIENTKETEDTENNIIENSILDNNEKLVNTLQKPKKPRTIKQQQALKKAREAKKKKMMRG